MNSTMWAGIMGLVGSIIGGISTYYGSRWATDRAIDAQNRREEIAANYQSERDRLLKVDQVRVTVKAMLYDFETATNEIIKVIRANRQEGVERKVEHFPTPLIIIDNPSEKIGALSEYFSQKDIYQLRKLYGIINAYNMRAEQYLINESNYNACFNYSMMYLRELWKGFFNHFLDRPGDINDFNVNLKFQVGDANSDYQELINKMLEF